MCMDDYTAIDIHTAETEVVAQLGKPVAKHKLADGAVEYEYVERIKIGSRSAETRHYFITIKNGQVVSKRVKQTIPLPYSFDSYDMQTTQNLED